MRQENHHVLDPRTTEIVPLDRLDRQVIEEALRKYAEEEIDDENGTESTLELVRHIASYKK